MKKFLLASAAIAALATGAQAADLGSARSPIPAAVMAPAGFNWTGFYLGADVGYVATRYRVLDIAFPAAPASVNPNGFKVGVHLGYRHQFVNNFVLGVEADVSWLSANRTTNYLGFPANLARGRATVDGSVRGTMGVAVDRALLYATGGVSFLGINGCTPVGGVCFAGTNYSDTRIGWTVGAGLAYAVSNNWSVRAEYLYANYGTKNYVMPVFTARVTNETHTFRVGASYMFTTGGPVSARY